MGNSAAKCLQCVPETGAAGERLSFWYTAYLVQKETDANRKPPHRLNRRRSSGALPPPSAAWSIMDPPNSDFRKSMHTVVQEDEPALPPKPTEEKLAALFTAVDTDNNGAVSRAELKAKLAADDELQGLLKAAGLNPEFYVFEQLDADGDSKITLHEFTAPLRDADKSEATETQLDAALKTEDGRAELKALFDSLDANQDGVISVQEWGDGVAKHKDVIAKFFGGATIEEIGRQFARIDGNNDEKLSWDEMMAAAGITDA